MSCHGFKPLQRKGGCFVTVKEQEKPIYDDKVKVILRGLASGKDRDKLAEEAGNSNWKSIDMYMRRRNFTWHSQKQTYVPKLEPIEYDLMADSSKAGHAISLLSKEGADARTVAERLGFQDHRELAHYMNVKGYVWDNGQNNYVQKVGEDTVDEPEEPISAPIQRKEVTKKAQEQGLEQYLPLLEMLEKHKERLLDVIVPTSQTGTIPRFSVSGVGKTKTVQMINTLEQMVVDFSREKNISQRELFEVALIEFFRRYGYEQEVVRLLNR